MPWRAAGAVALVTVLGLSGIRRSSGLNILIFSITLLALGSFIVFGLPGAIDRSSANLVPILPVEENGGVSAFLYATVLMFVAYTGYARIATLGEEVTNPRRTIPRAIIVTSAVTATPFILFDIVLGTKREWVGKRG